MTGDIMKTIFLALLLAFTALPVYAQDFNKLHARQPLIIEGNGGTMEVVDGIELWSSGDPPHRFEVLGYIEDNRRISGLINQMRLKGLPGKLAKIAKENGGDAVVLLDSSKETIGYYSQGNATASGNTAWGSATSVPIEKRSSRYAVVKYLADAPLDPSGQ